MNQNTVLGYMSSCSLFTIMTKLNSLAVLHKRLCRVFYCRNHKSFLQASLRRCCTVDCNTALLPSLRANNLSGIPDNRKLKNPSLVPEASSRDFPPLSLSPLVPIISSPKSYI